MLLLESGGAILLESGGSLLLESGSGPSACVGDAWEPGAWATEAWATDAWCETVVPPPVPPAVSLGGLGGKLHLSDLRELVQRPPRLVPAPSPVIRAAPVPLAPVTLTGTLRVRLAFAVAGALTVDRAWRRRRDEDEALILELLE